MPADFTTGASPMGRWLLVAWLLSAVGARTAVAADPDLAAQGFALAKKYCYDCHGVKFNGNAALNIADPAALLENGFLGNSKGELSIEDSELWRRINDGEMPPDIAPQKPNKAEKEILKQWLSAGAPKPKRDLRQPVSIDDLTSALLDDLKTFAESDRKFYRYFSLVHLHNNPDISDFDLRLYRAALSKTLNSLSYEPDIVLPQEIDESGTLLRFDLREIGWDETSGWNKLLKRYPYGVGWKTDNDPALGKKLKELEELAETSLAYVRADWFVIAATQPDLYYDIMEIPATAAELEELVGFSFRTNFDKNQLLRAGFAESGVSTANRLVERHRARLGKYIWISYDFAPNREQSDLMRFPLGPDFDDHPFAKFAFTHDGGEIIFGLPNGLQAYMLVDGKGNQIGKGPTDVVRDKTEISGSVAVVNAISCMHCHQHGLIKFTDTVRSGMGISGDAREKALELYPPKEEMEQKVQGDIKRFVEALDEACGPFLKVGDDRDKPIERFPEPIGAVSRYYQRDLDLTIAVHELGLPNDKLIMNGNAEFQAKWKGLGLGPLLNGSKIKRTHWENQAETYSPFQRASRLLGLGHPILF